MVEQSKIIPVNFTDTLALIYSYKRRKVVTVNVAKQAISGRPPNACDGSVQQKLSRSASACCRALARLQSDGCPFTPSDASSNELSLAKG